MIIRILGIRSRSFSSTISRSRIPELVRGKKKYEQALTAPDHRPGLKTYTQEEYRTFLDEKENLNPKVYVSDPRKNLSDAIRADNRDASERFRNRKITIPRTHSRDERIAHVANSKMPEKIKNKTIVRPSHDWKNQVILDKRWPQGIVPPSINEQKYVSEYNEFYRESFEGQKSEPHHAKAEVPLSQSKTQERIRNRNFDYFPAPHQIGHDHKLGVMPTEILWKDERTNYWKGLQDEDNPDQEKKMKMKDKRNKWFRFQSDRKDEMLKSQRGNPRRGSFKSHSGHANVDLRYYDPNILRIGQDWMPEKFHSDAVEVANENENAEILYFKGADALEDKLAIDSAPENELAYLIPSFTERSSHPQGLPRYDDALIILGAEEIHFDKNNLNEIEEIENFEKIQQKVKNIIRHGKIEQVDAGEFGLDQPIFDKFDPRFGSIDKTNQFKGHCDQQSLYDDQWIWDERHGIIKPERSSKIIAKNLTTLFNRIINLKCFRLPEQNIISQFPVIGGQQMCLDDKSTEVWYSSTQPKVLEGEIIQKNDENDIFNPLQLFSAESRIHPADFNQLTPINKLEISQNIHTLVIHDHPIMAFEQDEMNPDRYSGDREVQRKFLPHLREELDDQESLGRLLYATYGMLYNKSLNKSEGPLVANGVCISNGKKIHFHLVQVQLDSMNPDDKEKLKVCNLGSFDLYKLCDQFVWNRNDRIEDFRPEALHDLLKCFKLISS